MKTLATALLFSAASLQYACTPSDAGTIAAGPSIRLTPGSITLNSQQLTRPVSLSQIKAILGPPSRTQTNTAQEAADKLRRFGAVPNDIYTYDGAGILVYQKPGKPYIESISLAFRNEGLAFSPSQNFRGTLSIGGQEVTRLTSSDEMRDLSGMRLSPSAIKKHPAKYGVHDLFFDFGRLSEADALAGVAITLGPAQQTNAKGWAASEIKIMRATVLQTPQLQQLASQYHFSLAAFADCYTAKVSTQLTKEQVQAPDGNAQSRIQSLMEGCIAAVAKK